jgi:hypothetical protein
MALWGKVVRESGLTATQKRDYLAVTKTEELDLPV